MAFDDWGKCGEEEIIAKLSHCKEFDMKNIVETDQSITEEEKDALNENVNSLIEKKFTAKSDVPRALICSITKVRVLFKQDDHEESSL